MTRNECLSQFQNVIEINYETVANDPYPIPDGCFILQYEETNLHYWNNRPSVQEATSLRRKHCSCGNKV